MWPRSKMARLFDIGLMAFIDDALGCVSSHLRADDTKRNVVLLALAGIMLAGCAGGKGIVRTHVQNPPPIAVKELPRFSAIIADDGAAALDGELSPELRRSYKERQDEYVKNRLEAQSNQQHSVSGAKVAEGVGAGVYMCIYAGVALPIVGLVVCPFTIVGGAIAGAAAGPSLASSSSGGLPDLLIPDGDFARLGDFFKREITAAALAERTTKLVSRPDTMVSHSAEGRLVVRLRSAQLSYIRYVIARPSRSQNPFKGDRVEITLEMRIAAEAEAILADGTTLPVTEHVFEWQYGRIPKWADIHREAVEEGLTQALQAVAESIASTYTRTPRVDPDGADNAGSD